MSRLRKRKRESRLQLTQDLCKTIYTANVNTNAIEHIKDLIAKGAYLNKFVDVCLASIFVSVKPLEVALCWKGYGSKHDEHKSKRVEIVKILLENGADPNHSARRPFLICCLLRPIDDNFIKYQLDTVIKIVNMLLDAGADPNERDSYDGKTSLFYALNTFPEVVETLVRHGANPFITDNFGYRIQNCNIGICNKDISMYTENFQEAYRFLRNYMLRFVSEDDLTTSEDIFSEYDSTTPEDIFISYYNGAKQAEGLLMVFYARMPPNTDVIDLVSNQLPTFSAGHGKYRLLVDGLVEEVTREYIHERFHHERVQRPQSAQNTCSSLRF